MMHYKRSITLSGITSLVKKMSSKSSLNSNVSAKRSPGFYAGCDTEEKRQRRRQRNTESVRKYRERQKRQNADKQSSFTKHRKELQDILLYGYVCKEIRQEVHNSACRSMIHGPTTNSSKVTFNNFTGINPQQERGSHGTRPEWFGDPFWNVWNICSKRFSKQQAGIGNFF